MQLKSSSTLKSLTLSSTFLFSPTPSIFAYSDFDANSNVNTIISNPITQKYIRETNTDVYTDILMRNHFEEYLTQWKKNTMFYSFSNQITQDPNFQKIVAMGVNAAPLIVAEIKNKPSTLVWALNIIYNTKISDNPETTIEDACKLWVKQLS
jgi:hypothetical protein